MLLLDLVCPPALAQQKPPETIDLKLTLPQVTLVARGLAELPYKDVAGLLLEIQRQVTAQIAPSLPPPEKEPGK